MTTRSRSRPEKQAPRPRVQFTIDAILEATIRILGQPGQSLDGVTMTKIADVAGVSVGTLYHHFEDREAILRALQEREFTRALELLRDVLAPENVGASPRATIEKVVRGLATLYAASPALHRLLAIEALRREGSPDRVQAFDLRVLEVIRGFLLASRDQLRVDDLDAAAFVAFQSVRATMLATLLERPPGLDPEKLTPQLVDMVLRYLVRDAVTGPEARAMSRRRDK